MSDVQHIHAVKKHHRVKDRRKKTRAIISAPVRVRGVVGPDRDFDEITTTVNLSPAGILIETANAGYYRTMRVSVTLPYEESEAGAHTEQEGRVVRIAELQNGRRSVAIAFAHAAEDHAGNAEEPESEAASNSSVHQVSAHHVPKQIAPLVLVLESERAASEFMASYLSSEGYEVIAVKTSAEARSVLDERVPSLLIAEIEGEGMPGYTLCSHCKETPRLKPVPVMLLTSSAYPSDYAKAHSLGAVVCMAKPYKRERLGHVVRLLAPPPHANQAAPPRPPDASRYASLKSPKIAAPNPARKFRLPSMFSR
jgi:CheY-like chemotaxis protein